jgi:flavin-dependent dehydrogenase
MDVLVRDRAAFPRDKPCAGWVTPPVLEALGLDPRAYVAAGHTLQPFTAFRVGLIGRRTTVTAGYGRPASFGILRAELDHHLLERSGAPFRGGTPVSRLVRLRDTWMVDEEIRAPIVVGAGGHFCPVARHLGGTPVGGALVVAREVEFRMDARQRALCRVSPEEPELYFCPDLLGYGWCVRKGDHLNVGLGRRDPRGLRAHVARFVDFLVGRGRVPWDLPARWHGHAYRLYGRPARRVVDDGVLLVGDAAGLALAASGEGIGPAAESGALAAEVILGARGRHRREDLEPYDTLLRQRFGPRPRTRTPARAAVLLAPPLLSSPWFTRHVVLDRWFLRARPAPGPRRVHQAGGAGPAPG